MPFLLIISSFLLNYKFNISNEIIILKQYLSLKDNLILILILNSGILLTYFFNNEFFSVNLYHKYKVKELEIRNNLKLGLPSTNEFHIEDDVSIFFKKQIDNKFLNVEAIIFNDGQFIKSREAYIEIEKKNYNIIFNIGERITLNDDEKSKTSFDKFVYSIENREIEELMFDKEHYNTVDLLKNDNVEFYYQGHNRIYQYFLVLIITFISLKVFFVYTPKKSVFKFYLYLFIGLLVIQLINSYLIFLLKNNINFKIYYYYLINFLILIFFSYLIFNSNENN